MCQQPLAICGWPQSVPHIGYLLLGKPVRLAVGDPRVDLVTDLNRLGHMANSFAFGEQFIPQMGEFSASAAVALAHLRSPSPKATMAVERRG